MIRYIERSLIYRAPSPERGNWHSRWVDKEDVWFHAADGTKIHGWFVPHAEARHVVLYSHGNSEHVGYQVNTVLRLQAMLDATVLVYDYRGYGHSEGKPTEAGLISDGLAAQQWLAERTGLLPEDIVLVGRSLGGGVSVAVAAERGARALVLDATFSRMIDAARYNYPWLPVGLFMRDRYDSLARIEQYYGPVFQSHRATDEVVPVSLARQLIERAPGTVKQFYEMPTGRHDDPLPADYYTALKRFLHRAAGEQNGDRKPLVLSPSGTLSMPTQVAS